MQAITQGGQELNQPPPRPDSPGEDGPGEPDIDGKTQAPNQDFPQFDPPNLFPLQPRCEKESGVLRQTSNDKGNDWGDFAWNWHRPGGGPPWWDLDEGTLSVARKTHLLQNTYLTNIK